MSETCESIPLWDSVQHMIIHVTNRCNLNCRYCFEKHGQLEDMTEERMIKILDRGIDAAYFRALQAEKNNQKNNASLSISFFGGEPLLKFDMIKRGVEYVKKHKTEKLTVSFGVTTNGTLMTKDVVDFMADNNFSIILSVDGPKDLHDKNRVFADGSGSYDLVIDKIPYLLQKLGAGRVTIRPSFVPETAHRLFEIAKFCQELGFISMAIIPVMDAGHLGEAPDWDEVWGVVESQYRLIADWWYHEVIVQRKKLDVKLIRDFFRDFLSRSQKITGLACGTGIMYQAFGPDGNIYPCHRLVNDIHSKDKIVGSIDDESMSKEVYDKRALKREDFQSTLNCSSCAFEYICTKGCNVVNLKVSGNHIQVPEDQCRMLYIQYKIGMYILARYGMDIRLFSNQVTNGPLRNMVMRFANAAIDYQKRKSESQQIKSSEVKHD